MLKKNIFIFLSIIFISLLAFPKVKYHHVFAYVETGKGAIKAIMIHGEFKIPDGKVAEVVSFWWADPKTGRSTKKLGKNIYSLETKSYMLDKDGKPLTTLPAGKYKLIVGGYPGAKGKLTYKYK